MTIKAEDVFNPNDFKPIKLKFEFRDLTTGMSVKDSKKVALLEFGDKQLVLALPAKSCNKKHSAMLDVYRVDKNPRKPILVFSATGKISELENVSADEVRATLHFLQYDDHSWIKFQNLFANRQAEIEKFMTAVRGY